MAVTETTTNTTQVKEPLFEVAQLAHVELLGLQKTRPSVNRLLSSTNRVNWGGAEE